MEKRSGIGNGLSIQMKVVSLTYARNNNYRDPESWISRIASATRVLEVLSRFADVVSIHCIGYEGRVKRSGVEYVFLRLSRMQSLLPISFHRLIKETSPDVVIVHGIIFPLQVILLRLQLGKSVTLVVQDHLGGPHRFLRNLLQRWADRFTHVYLFTSAEHAEPWLKSGLISDRRKVRQSYEGSSVFYPIDSKTARKKTGVEGPLVYLWVGRLNANKDPLTMVKAFIAFLEQGNKASLYMIFHTEELLQDINSLLAAHPGVSNSVHLVGKLDHIDLIYWYNSADFLVSASSIEGTSFGTCEAMSCGCIPIVTDIPSFRTMTGHGKVGLFFRPGDEKGLLDALVKSTRLDLESEKRKVLDHFEKELSFEAIAKKLYEIVSSPDINRE